ncbi:hypothetical protein [Pelomonas cellulosilytica]|uniref:Uncharacterized protein n=1 Tax=Pelomonas cellulosilytica TaxID=2906762 RepID=A0ABS8XYT7_9BURK|nr:hypothetical protein [Pelomonas sp. P8]MCE4557792.1 hypothetical protein [Pelomonas sp. P8]
MTALSRWIASLPLTPLAALTLQGVAPVTAAFTDSNAEMKDAVRTDSVVVGGKAARPPMQAAYVPTSAKKLDGFKPVLPPEPPPSTRQVAKSELPTSARR